MGTRGSLALRVSQAETCNLLYSRIPEGGEAIRLKPLQYYRISYSTVFAHVQHLPLLFSFAAAAHPAPLQQSPAHLPPFSPSVQPLQFCRRVTRIVRILLPLCSCNTSHSPLLAQHAACSACLRLPTLQLCRCS